MNAGVNQLAATVSTPPAPSCYVCGKREFTFVMPYRAAPTDTIFQQCAVVKCQACGLRQINKHFSPAAIEAYYRQDYDRDKIYHADLTNFPADNPWGVSRGRALAKNLITHVPTLAESPTVLDIGCGYGYLLFGFNQHVHNATIIGMDYDTQTKAIFDAQGWTFHEGGITDVPSNYAGTIDILITSHVFEHVLDPHDFLERCKALLSPRGVLVWEMPNLNEFGLRCEKRHSPHICLWDGDSLQAIMRNHGMDVVFFGFAGKEYTWYHQQNNLGKLVRMVRSRVVSEPKETVRMDDKNSIGFQLDQYGDDHRRNLRIIARKSE